MQNINLKIQNFKKNLIEDRNTKEYLYELIDQVLDNMTLVNNNFHQAMSDVDQLFNTSVVLNEIELINTDYKLFVKSYKAKLITDIQKTFETIQYTTKIIISDNFGGNLRPIQAIYVSGDVIVSTDKIVVESLLDAITKNSSVKVDIVKRLLTMFD